MAHICPTIVFPRRITYDLFVFSYDIKRFFKKSINLRTGASLDDKGSEIQIRKLSLRHRQKSFMK